VNADHWQLAWAAMQQAVGRDFGRDQPEVWGERIEQSMLLRYLEPLEFGSLLHADAGEAGRQGHAAVPVPATALASLSLPLLWRPGDVPMFLAPARDAMPRVAMPSGPLSGLEPPTSHVFAVGSDADYLGQALVGDRLCRRGARLLSCLPKQTRVGRGAFVQWETEVVNERRDLLARLRTTYYRYNPR